MSTLDDMSKKADTLVEEYIPYIRALAQRLLPNDRGYLEADELIQRVSIRLWLTAKTQDITYPKAYIARIVNSVYVDMQREYKPVFPLPVTEEGELMKGNPLINRSEGMGDPQEELEREEAFVERLHMLSSSIVRLPPQQRRAILLRLKKRVDNLLLVMMYLRKYELHMEREHWPTGKVEKRRLASSAAPALEKIEAFFRNMRT